MFEILKACKTLAGEALTTLPPETLVKFSLITDTVTLAATSQLREGKIATLVVTNNDDNYAVLISQTRPMRKPRRASEIYWCAGDRENRLLEKWLTHGDALEDVYRAQTFLREIESLVAILEANTQSS